MTECHRIRNMFVDELYHELDTESRKKLLKHLKTCSSCAAEFHDLSETLGLMNEYRRPLISDTSNDVFLNRLEQTIDAQEQLDAATRKKLPFAISLDRTFFRRAASLTATAAAALLIGIFLGRTYFPRIPGLAPVTVVEKAAPARNLEQTPEERAVQYIDRAERVLLSVVNADLSEELPYRPSFARQREFSRALLDESTDIRDALEPSTPSQARLMELMDNMEVILMQIAALDTAYTLDDLAFIQSSAERKAVLFKMNLDAVLSAAEPIEVVDTSDSQTLPARPF
jgi:hypothetical protein